MVACKARCLALLDEVRDSGTEIIVTKRGRPVARLAPVEAEKTYKSSFGHMKGSAIQLCSDEELFSTDEVWEAESDEPSVPLDRR